jgi:hypothetical protein
MSLALDPTDDRRRTVPSFRVLLASASKVILVAKAAG